ncbi:MAG: NAD(P)/FAD-dependent oxidoreductase [Clostridia bacterium]|nr:NAD(P)/FAD-dependent oxidoreductase [Clostridia bacterium]
MTGLYDVAVIGAGPAGLMAAGRALEEGASVLLLDKLAVPGKKLYITGKGRCNVTNDTDVRTVLDNVPRNPKFLYSALSAFTPADAKAFFLSRGIPLKTERGRRVFPVSDKAADIARGLADYAAGAEKKIARVKALRIREGRIKGLTTGEKEEIGARTVIVATGGLSYPATGSTGDGYRFAEDAGHAIREPGASLSALVSDEGLCRAAMGVSLRNVSVRFFEDGKKVFEEFGEMLFTHFGVSGPVILSGSAHFERAASEKRIEIDFKPALDDGTLDRRLLREIAEGGEKETGNLARSLLPQSLARPFVARCGVDPRKKARDLTRGERQALAKGLKGTSLRITGLRPVEEAIVTRGGVDVREVDPRTMASKLVKGLYFAGEVLDVDAYTGGYNMQIAMATGRAAGRAAAVLAKTEREEGMNP